MGSGDSRILIPKATFHKNLQVFSRLLETSRTLDTVSDHDPHVLESRIRSILLLLPDDDDTTTQKFYLYIWSAMVNKHDVEAAQTISSMRHTLNFIIVNFASRLTPEARATGRVGEQSYQLAEWVSKNRRLPTLGSDDEKECNLARWLLIWKQAGQPEFEVAQVLLHSQNGKLLAPLHTPPRRAVPLRWLR